MQENRKILIDIFRKTICSLAVIKEISHNEVIVLNASKFITILSLEYVKLIEKKKINMKSIVDIREDIIAFSYDCIEDKSFDLVKLAEDVQYGYIDLLKYLK